MSARPNVAVVGIGRSMTRRGDSVRKSVLQLQVEAARAAMAEAGIVRSDVGALFTGRMPRANMALQWNQMLTNELKLSPVFSTEVTAHGAGALGTLQYAALAVGSGLVDYALCASGDASPVWIDVVGTSATWESDLQFETPYGPTTPSIYALSARRYMYEYGITRAQMAHVAVENRRWALDHPFAAMRTKGPINIEAVLTSPPIATPLHLLDCAAWFPGGIGGAAVVTSNRIARSHDSSISIIGFGQRSTHEWVTERLETFGVGPYREGASLVRTGAKMAAEQAFTMAGLKPADIDVVESSAPFTFANLLMLEELGFCEEGEGGTFVADGGVDYEGGLAYNTSGGYLSFGQSGQGLYFLKEAVDQLRGTAEGRQVQNVATALVHGHGGPLSNHSVIILAKE